MSEEAKSQETSLFLRKATGLVRSWSVFDAFIYAFFSINLITLGLYSFSQMYYFEGGLMPTLIISGIFIIFEVVVYAALIAVMPRAGGDYVWQSRILGGGIGFVLAVTGWWFILWLWVPLYADMLRQLFFTPLLGILGATGAALWFSNTPIGLFVTAVIVCIIVGIYIAIGMKWYSRIQKWCFWISIVALAIVLLFLLFGNNASFQAGLKAQAPEMFGAAENVYDKTIAAGRGSRRHRPPLWRHAGRHLPGHPLHRLLQPVAQLGGDALWRGARRDRFQAQLLGNGLGADRHHHPGRRLFPADLQDDHLGLVYERQRGLVELSLGLYRAGTAAAHLALPRAAGRLYDPQPHHSSSSSSWP